MLLHAIQARCDKAMLYTGNRSMLIKHTVQKNVKQTNKQTKGLMNNYGLEASAHPLCKDNIVQHKDALMHILKSERC